MYIFMYLGSMIELVEGKTELEKRGVIICIGWWCFTVKVNAGKTLHKLSFFHFEVLLPPTSIADLCLLETLVIVTKINFAVGRTLMSETVGIIRVKKGCG